jgi:hypothetical protein
MERPRGTGRGPTGCSKAGRAKGSGLAVAYCPHPAARAVSSVLGRFTAVFGMGTGGTTPLGPPDHCPARVPRGKAEIGRQKDEGGSKPREASSFCLPISAFGSGRGIRTPDLRVMSPTSYHCSIPRREAGGSGQWAVGMAPYRTTARYRLPKEDRATPPHRSHVNNAHRTCSGAAANHQQGIPTADCPLPIASRAWRAGARAKPSAISTAQLQRLRAVHLPPIHLVVYEGPYSHEEMGRLILGPVSRLDAFSASPFRSWLPGTAPGGTTGTPADRPPRSSRTRGSPPQASCAHDG